MIMSFQELDRLKKHKVDDSMLTRILKEEHRGLSNTVKVEIGNEVIVVICRVRSRRDQTSRAPGRGYQKCR